MFTGIVRARGRTVSSADSRLVVESELDAGIGDSVAVDGVCLTVVENATGRLGFDVAPETIARAKRFGAEVNLELPVRAGEPLGGHYLQGHVDGVARVRSIEPEGDGRRLWVDAAPELLRYCVEKGSVALDGVSLTIAALDDRGFATALVPHTLTETTLGGLGPGDELNLEVDVLAKYVERLVGSAR